MSLGCCENRKEGKPTVDPDTLSEYPADVSKYYFTEPDADMPIRVGKKGVAAQAPTTVMERFFAAVKNHASEPALMNPEGDSWRKWTWQEYYDDTLKAARSFVHLGLEPFESVNILGFNSPEWLIANLGAIFAGGKAAGIYTTNTPEACQYITDHSEARVVVVENKAQLDKYIAIRDSLPRLKAIVMYKDEVPEGVNVAGKAAVYTWADFMALSANVEPKAVHDRMAAQSPGHCCTLIYTSGTTGMPKAVMISHDNLVWTCDSMMESVFDGDFGAAEEHIVSYLPLSHIAAQMLDIHIPINTAALKPGNCTVWFARPDALKGTLGDTLRAVRPTFCFGVPRVWEKIQEKIMEAGAQTQGIKKSIASWAKGRGALAHQEAQSGGSRANPWGFTIAKGLVFDKVRATLGLDRCRSLFTGAAPISQDTLRFFGALDLYILELYGMSECTGPQNVSRPDLFVVGACGPPLKGTELKLDHVEGRDKPGEGEICMRGRHIMMGYMKNEEKSKETIDHEGFLHSGDVGAIDEFGLLHITGRIKELIIGAGGENIAPVPAEDKLKAELPGISNAMMVGDKRKYNIVLITLRQRANVDTGDFYEDLVGAALEVSEASKTVQEAKADPKWKEYIEAGIKRYNDTAVSNAAKIQKFAILDKDFSVPGDDLTATLKLKRATVSEKNSAIIEALYA